MKFWAFRFYMHDSNAALTWNNFILIDICVRHIAHHTVILITHFILAEDVTKIFILQCMYYTVSK
jgi:hypothetical protein